MWVQKRPHWSARKRVPDNKHRVFAAVSSDDPPLIIGACGRAYFVTMALQEFLGLLLVVVDDSRVGSAVEDLRPVLRCEVVHPLIDIFVKAENPLEVQGGDAISFKFIGLLTVVPVLHYICCLFKI